MRVRVSLDFDILIESLISLCIIETVGAILREYKAWIVLKIFGFFVILIKKYYFNYRIYQCGQLSRVVRWKF